jgi:UDP-N-acetylmuramyl pentapeptide synthase
MSALFTADQILYATASTLKSGRTDDQQGRIVWDLEDIREGDWFIAIPSQFTDPHDHLGLALERGARGLIVNRRSRYSSATKDATIISVADTRTALLDLVRYWRYSVQPRVVGVAGSSGRRSTMELLSQLLKDNFKTHTAFMTNLGWFGCVKDVLSMPADTQVLIFEAGAVERGDITRIGGALDPDLAVLTPIRHPLPSAERDAFSASLYCELLETLSSCPKERLAAVIYDDNAAVQKRADEVLCGLLGQKYSQSGRGIAQRLPQEALNVLNKAMASKGLTVSRADLWCAVEAAKALGVSKAALEKTFELDSDLSDKDAATDSIKQLA